jgi:hypothetical protein
VSDSYTWRGGQELLFRHGNAFSLQIIIIQPLFEESNRCRRLLARMIRGLAANGIGTVLPDLPGTGESLRDISTVAFDDWQDALRMLGDKIKPSLVASIRGGVLLDATIAANGHWRFAPETGARIVRDLRRTQISGSPLYAGHAIGDAFLDRLENATPPLIAPLRTLRLESDAGVADAHVAGTPLWRRAEPGDDAALAAALVGDLTDWAKQCAN